MPNVDAADLSAKQMPSEGGGDDVWVWGWILEQADRFRFLVFGFIVVLYALGMNGQWLMTPDSAIHLNVATNLVEAHTYASASGNQERINPGLPWLLSTVFMVFGPEAILQAKMVIMFMALANLCAVFWLFRYTIDRPTAVVVTFLAALSENAYQYAFYLLTDTPFALGLTLFLCGLARSEKPELKRPWIHWLLMIGGAAVMAAFRLVFVTFLVGLALYLAIRTVRDRKFIRQTALILGVLVVTLAISFITDPRRHMGSATVVKEKQIYVVVENFSAFVKDAVRNRIPNEVPLKTVRAVFGVNIGNYPSIPFAILFLVCALFLLRTHLLWGCIVIAFLGQWILFYFDSRYFVAVQPLWVFAYLQGGLWVARTLVHPERLPRWVYLMIYPTRYLPLTYSDRTLLVFLVLYLFSNGVRIERFISIQRSPDPLVGYESGQYKNLPEMGRFIKDNTPPDAVIVTEYDLFPEITTYLSKRRTVKLLAWLANPTPIDKAYLLAPISPMGHDRVAETAVIVYPPMCELPRPHLFGKWVLHRLEPLPGK